MRKAMLFLTAFALAGSLWAADPIIGTWKLNVSKSKIGPSGTSPKELTEIYREIEDDKIEYSREGTQINGTVISSKWTFPGQGGVVKRLYAHPNDVLYVDTLMEPGNWYLTVLLKGVQLTVAHKIISKDGKTMTQTVKGYSNIEDKPLDEILVFERQ